jgi:ferrous iron transport protein B
VCLSEIEIGTTAVVDRVEAPPSIATRLGDLGFIPGTPVTSVRRAPLGDPGVYEIRGVSTAGDPKPGPSTCASMGEAGAAVPLRFGLLGAPNSGKTTLFNALTGLRARVGNFPGVTVERREGRAEIDGRRVVLIDLPGTYSLAPISPDEAIVSRVLAGEIAEVPAPDALIVTMDACSLERSLLLLAQALHQRKPTCLVLTMVDELRARGGEIDLPRLSNALGIPVVGVVGHRGVGLDGLRRLLGRPEEWIRPHMLPPEKRRSRAAWLDSILSNVSAGRAKPGDDAVGASSSIRWRGLLAPR